MRSRNDALRATASRRHQIINNCVLEVLERRQLLSTLTHDGYVYSHNSSVASNGDASVPTVLGPNFTPEGGGNPGGYGEWNGPIQGVGLPYDVKVDVRALDGAALFETTEFSSDGFGMRWALSRGWTNDSYSQTGYGSGWRSTQMPHLAYATVTVGGVTSVVAVGVVEGQTVHFFNQSGGTLTSTGPTQDTMTLASNLYTWVRTDGTRWVFQGDFLNSSVKNAGALLRVVAPGDDTSVVTPVYTTTLSYDGTTGVLNAVTRRNAAGTELETWDYTYTTSGDYSETANQGLIKTVALKRQTNGGGVRTVRTVLYEYYETADSFGIPGNLKLATIKDGSGYVVDEKYYRYHTAVAVSSLAETGASTHIAIVTAAGHGLANGDRVTITGVTGSNAAAFNGSFEVFDVSGDTFKYSLGAASQVGSMTGTIKAVKNAFEGALMYAFDERAFARLKAAQPSDFETVSNATVAPYADRYYEFDGTGQKKVRKLTQRGPGVAAGDEGTFFLTYTASSNSPGTNSWANKVEVRHDDPDLGDSYDPKTTTYVNAQGAPMLIVRTGGDGSVLRTFIKYDSSGRRIWIAQPNAVTGFNDSYADLMNESGDYQYISDSAGEIYVLRYHTAEDGTSAAGANAPGRINGMLKEIAVARGETSARGTEESAPPKVATFEYCTQSSYGATVILPGAVMVYNESQATNLDRRTAYGYAWDDATVQISRMFVKHPVVGSGLNGPGSQVDPDDSGFPEIGDLETAFFDQFGRMSWHQDGRGYISYTAFDDATGAVLETIAGVDLSLVTGEPTTWGEAPEDGPHVRSVMTADDLGRLTSRTDYVTSSHTNVTRVVYRDASGSGPLHEVRVYPGWTGSGSSGSTTGPIQVYREDRAGSYYEWLTSSATPATSSGLPLGSESLTKDNIQSLRRAYLNAGGHVESEDRYFNVAGLTTYSAAADLGTASNDTTSGERHRTAYEYDAFGRVVRKLAPTGTITRAAYDGLNRQTTESVGTDDGVSTSNMADVRTFRYDTVGRLDRVTEKPGAGAADRLTDYFYDWRSRVVAVKLGASTDSTATASETTSVNRGLYYLDRDFIGTVVNVDRYDGDQVWMTSESSGDGVPDKPSSSLRRASTDYAFDTRDRLIMTEVQGVHQSGGSVGNTTGDSVNWQNWYDRGNNIVKSTAPNSPANKFAYDGADRLIETYRTDGGSDTSWADAGGLLSDTVIEQVEYAYNGIDNITLVTTRQRFHDAVNPSTGTLTSADFELGTPASTVNPQARVSFVGYHYDLAGRTTAEVNVGTNGGSAYTAPTPADSIPGGSATVLVTNYSYNAAGQVAWVTSPRGIKTKYVYDDLDRVTQATEAYSGSYLESYVSDPSPSASSDRVTRYTYNGLNDVLKMTAALPSSGQQVTEYVYGESQASIDDISSSGTTVTVETDTAHNYKVGEKVTVSGTGVSQYNGERTISAVTSATVFQFVISSFTGAASTGTVRHSHGAFSNDFLSAVKYPAKSGGAASDAERENTLFNALGETIGYSDRGGNVHDYSYDLLGRFTEDYVSTLGSAFQGSVRRLQYSYDPSGKLYEATSRSSNGSGNIVVNQVRREYNPFGQLAVEHQEHDGAVDGSTAIVQYEYAQDDADNYTRLSKMTYPGGSELHYIYASGLNDDISRVSSLSFEKPGEETPTPIESYSYLGESTWVIRDRPENDTELTYDSGHDTVTADAGDRYVGLDRFGRIVDQRWRKYSGTPADLDRFTYGYDRDDNVVFKKNEIDAAFSELYSADATDVNSAYDNLGRLTAFQRGTLSDSLGGGLAFDTVASESRSQAWTLDALGNWDSLTSSSGNETRTHNSQNQISTSGYSYDANGNLLDMSSSTSSPEYRYDAWNRLAEYATQAFSISASRYEYPYDALHRRVVDYKWTDYGGASPEDPEIARVDLYYSNRWQVIEDRSEHSALESETTVITNSAYVWSPGYVDDLVMRDRSVTVIAFGDPSTTEQRLYAQHDHNFNVTSLVTTAGAVQDRIVYDPYGAWTAYDGSYANAGASRLTDKDWAYLHQGGRQNEINGLYSFRYRELNAGLGRWMQQDPAGYVDSPSRYVLLIGCPTSFVDPWGLRQERPRDRSRAGNPGIGPSYGLMWELGQRVGEAWPEETEPSKWEQEAERHTNWWREETARINHNLALAFISFSLTGALPGNTGLDHPQLRWNENSILSLHWDLSRAWDNYLFWRIRFEQLWWQRTASQ